MVGNFPFQGAAPVAVSGRNEAWVRGSFVALRTPAGAVAAMQMRPAPRKLDLVADELLSIRAPQVVPCNAHRPEARSGT